MKLVAESLEELNNLKLLEGLNEDLLVQQVLNEKIDINGIKNIAIKTAVLSSMLIVFATNKFPNLKDKLPSKDDIGKSEMIQKMANDPKLEKDATFDKFEDMLHKLEQDLANSGNNNVGNKEIFSMSSTPQMIDEINKAVGSTRFSEDKIIKQYDKYDEEILSGLKELEKIGEKTDPNFIKTFMVIETSMKPRKNEWGFEGFPQTKQNNIDYVNKKFNTSYTMSDMYDAKKSAQFIHYLTKLMKKSKYVNSQEDLMVAYNFGASNLGKVKAGTKKLSKQASDYLVMYKVFKKHFGS